MLKLNALSLRNKLLLIVAIPILALLYFSISGIVEKSAVSGEMKKLEALVKLSSRLGMPPTNSRRSAA